MSEGEQRHGTGAGQENRAAVAGQERLAAQVARIGMFRARTTGGTSGYGARGCVGLRRCPAAARSAPIPMRSRTPLPARRGKDGRGFCGAVERVAVDRCELTLHVRSERLPEVAAKLRDDPALAFELCPPGYPVCDWHERETWDVFGIVFDGPAALTRIEIPGDWKGHPQRKDYSLGGIPAVYGATVPPD